MSLPTTSSPVLPHALAEESELSPRKRVSIARIVAELWDARDLVVQFILRDITVRYTQAVMGFAWALLMPMLIVGAGLVFRIVISNLSGTESQTSGIASLLVKALPWSFFSVALSTATQSILAYANLIGKVKFPRESLPLASVVGQGTDLAVGTIFVALLMPFLGFSLTWNILWAIPLLGLLITFTVGCGLILSCANLFYRDVKYIVQVLLNFGVFATPVFFEPQMLGPKFGAIMMSLPLSPFIQGIDVAVVRGHNLLRPLSLPGSKGMVEVWSPWMLGYAAALSVVALYVGLRIFRRGSAQFAEMA
ncbi:MAG: ABC transporter permease [Phycisphaerae bacterium]|nr:ABC transporter permease [Gemmatimonadaceae bacterium]